MNQCVNLLLIYKVKPLVLFLLRILVFRLLPLFLRKIASVRPSLINCLCTVTRRRNIYMGRSVSKIFFWVEVWKNNTNKYKKHNKMWHKLKNPKIFNFIDPKLFESAEISEVVRVTANKQLRQGWPYFNSSHYF